MILEFDECRAYGASFYDASYNPKEMLCIPMGLGICRPKTGLVYTSEKVNGIHSI